MFPLVLDQNLLNFILKILLNLQKLKNTFIVNMNKNCQYLIEKITLNFFLFKIFLLNASIVNMVMNLYEVFF